MVDPLAARVAEAIRREFPDARIILFGSRARGTALRDSDVDLIVVSARFHGMHFTDRTSRVLKAIRDGGVRPGVDVEALCYTPEEFERKRREVGIVAEAISYGMEL